LAARANGNVSIIGRISVMTLKSKVSSESAEVPEGQPAARFGDVALDQFKLPIGFSDLHCLHA